MNKNLKKLVSSIAALALSASCFTAFAANFSDVPDTSSYKNAIDELVALGIVNGYEDGTFKPDNEITRAEVTTLVVNAVGSGEAAQSSVGTSQFTDTAGHWAEGYINMGVAKEFIAGMGDGTFSPDTNVTYAQIVRMLVSAAGYTTAAEAQGGWPNGYLQVGNSTGITDGVTGIGADTAVTRGVVAQLIDNAIAVPMVAIVSWTTDIYGNPVGVADVMDGTDDKDYRTMLTEYHDAYKVRGRVTATHAQGSVEKDKVMFQVEYADNYDGDVIDVRGSNGTDPVLVEAYFGDTDAEANLFTYAEAILQKDDNDEDHLISIYPYGRNDIVELKASDYAALNAESTNPSIEFEISETSTRTKAYKLATNTSGTITTEMYVNGVEITSSFEDAVADYIENNDIGTVTLIDTPQQGSTSKDGKYDYVMVTLQQWAVVDSTTTTATTQRIYFDDSEGGFASLTIDLEDDEKSYSFKKDGADVDFDAITEGSVVLVAYDPTTRFADSGFYSFDISDKVVEGKISELRTDVDDFIYTIDGTDYQYVGDKDADTAALKTGSEYTLYLDATGRVVKYDELASSKNFGIIDRVYYDNNQGEYRVRIIKGDGVRSSYTVRDQAAAETAGKIAYGSTTSSDWDKVASLTPIVDRVVTYKLNTNSEIHSIYNTEDGDNGFDYKVASKSEYSQSGTKVSSVKMNDATQIVDLSKIVDSSTLGDLATAETEDSYSASDVQTASLSSFVDGEEYSVIGFDRSTDGYYRFVIVVEGVASVGVNAHFAVVDSQSSAIDEAEGIERTSLNVYSVDGEGELQTLFVDDDNETAAQGLSRGTVIAYGIDGDGMITDLAVLYEIDSATSAMTAEKAYELYNSLYNTDSDRLDGSDGEFYFEDSIVDAWNSSDETSSNGFARIGFGAILDKTSSSVTLGKICKGEVSGLSKADEYYTDAANTMDFDLANDVAVYVYDYNNPNRNGAGRVTMSTVAGITRTTVASALIDEDSNNDNFYNWSKIGNSENQITPTYAFFKVVDDEITDIFVIVPSEL